MPTNLRRLLAQAADADPLNTADADVQQMIADGIVIRRSKICPVKRKPVKQQERLTAACEGLTIEQFRAMRLVHREDKEDDNHD